MNDTTTTQTTIKTTFTVELTMTPEQVEAYAREYSFDAGRVGADVIGRLQETAEAALESEYWIRSFTTVAVSPPRLHENAPLV